ncbi:hypothetical protein [Aquibacillus salsiterrae]|uniref:Uncharacterized protein n=1 Tax=Aquibacillus salsiterrae TaxID=2950439 RepID=A0A9X4AE16_9BACI|nr:hypothetical protein [Aquibacillus salsiterrae]MDC3416242.1 hypothetical protein [Aquibacillus salsiterrae]
MTMVKMIVQTTYNGQLLRAGKEYEVASETAHRWDVSNIAKIVSAETEENHE